MERLESVEFDPASGLVPAVVQSTEDDRVLMLAYMNREALERTLEGGRVTFWSRSRQELWRKGDTSGNWLETVEVRTDCDGDALLVRARPHGPACHTGEESCFDAGGPLSGDGAPGSPDPGDAPRDLDDPGGAGAGDDVDLSTAGPSPAPVLASVLEELVAVVASRDAERPGGSYTTRVLESGPPGAARKVGEEALEVVISALDDPGQLAEESADLLYHLVVLWRAAGLPAEAVGRALSRRRGAGGEE
jgi:phosphoribosyl-ATP pyrophosphohydrolase/phosphoribosyl-AMP cyclohydrolase